MLFLRILYLLLILATPLNASQQYRIQFLMQKGHLSEALDLYEQQKRLEGTHHFELLQQIGLTLLEKGASSSDPEIQLFSLFGAGISANEQTRKILEDGLCSPFPQHQLVALNYLSSQSNDEVLQMINDQALASNFLLIRIEAARILAEKKHPKAMGQIEALMQKVPLEILPLFPQLLALIGDAQSTKLLRKMLTHCDPTVRIASILSVAKSHRDDLLPDIQKLASQHHTGQQEACAYALGILDDEDASFTLTKLAQSTNPTVRLAALHSLYRFGRKPVREEVERIAREGNIFAARVLSQMSGSENTLTTLSKNENIQIRTNAALSLLELHDPRCLPTLLEILLSNTKDLAFIKISSPGKSIDAIRVIPSSRQNLSQVPLANEISLSFREEILRKASTLPEREFLNIASAIFSHRQNDLVPLLCCLLENMQTPETTHLLTLHRMQMGAPLIRNYCNLVLYRQNDSSLYEDSLRQWICYHQNHPLIQFRPWIPHQGEISQFQLNPEETSRLLIDSFESLVQKSNDEAIDQLLQSIRYGNRKNKYALAGLLIRTAN